MDNKKLNFSISNLGQLTPLKVFLHNHKHTKNNSQSKDDNH